MTDNGLTIGPSGDVNIVSAGSLGNLTAGLGSGRFDAIDNSPPTTVVSNTIVIELWKIPALRTQPTAVPSATLSTIKAHPDTVQAVFTASTQGWQYTLKHPQGALRLSTPIYVSLLITSPEEIQYLVADELAHSANTPAMTNTGFKAIKDELAIVGTPIAFPKSSWIDNRFVDNAITQLGYSASKG